MQPFREEERKLKAKLFLLFLVILLVLPIVYAQPPQTQVFVGDITGLEIEYPKIINLQQDKNFTFNFHVYNKSNGYPMTNETIGCSFHLYDNIGVHTISYNHNGEMEFTDDYDFKVYVNEDNFTRLGEYSYIFQCNDSWLGGFVSTNVIVTEDGYISDPEYAMGFGLILIGVLFFFIYLSNSLGEKQYILKIMFIWFTFIILLPILWAAGYVAKVYAEMLGNGLMYIFYGYVPIFMFLTYYIVLSIIKYLFATAADRKERGATEII